MLTVLRCGSGGSPRISQPRLLPAGGHVAAPPLWLRLPVPASPRGSAPAALRAHRPAPPPPSARYGAGSGEPGEGRPGRDRAQPRGDRPRSARGPGRCGEPLGRQPWSVTGIAGPGPGPGPRGGEGCTVLGGARGRDARGELRCSGGVARLSPRQQRDARRRAAPGVIGVRDPRGSSAPPPRRSSPGSAGGAGPPGGGHRGARGHAGGGRLCLGKANPRRWDPPREKPRSPPGSAPRRSPFPLPSPGARGAAALRMVPGGTRAGRAPAAPASLLPLVSRHVRQRSRAVFDTRTRDAGAVTSGTARRADAGTAAGAGGRDAAHVAPGSSRRRALSSRPSREQPGGVRCGGTALGSCSAPLLSQRGLQPLAGPRGSAGVSVRSRCFGQSTGGCARAMAESRLCSRARAGMASGCVLTAGQSVVCQPTVLSTAGLQGRVLLDTGDAGCQLCPDPAPCLHPSEPRKRLQAAAGAAWWSRSAPGGCRVCCTLNPSSACGAAEQV